MSQDFEFDDERAAAQPGFLLRLDALERLNEMLPRNSRVLFENKQGDSIPAAPSSLVPVKPK